MKISKHKQFFRMILVAATSVMLTACLTSPPAPVINKSPNRTIPAEREVAAGESIYAISWEYGIDFLDIAKWNNLKPPYRLQTGRKLVLRPGTTASVPASDGVVVNTLPQADTSSSTLSAPLPQKEPVQSRPSVSKTPTKSEPAVATTKTPNLAPLSKPKKWQWPATGDVVEKYSPKKGINGIQIAAAAGSPVRASAEGDVVYVGEGLRGYGKLIIVKHSTEFLSAYAHNRRILVAEGDRVKSSQQIAEMGNSGASRTMLHFEIRVNGKPEDPLKYLR